MTYRLSTAGKLTVLTYIIATLGLMVFAAWLALDTLGLKLSSWSASWATAQPTWTSGQITVAAGLLVVLCASPLLLWNLLAEALIRYTPTDSGLLVRTLGINHSYPWASMSFIHPADRAGLHQRDDVLLAAPHGRAWSHWLLNIYGRLPIYAHVHDRERLLATIQDRLGQPAESALSATDTATTSTSSTAKV